MVLPKSALGCHLLKNASSNVLLNVWPCFLLASLATLAPLSILLLLLKNAKHKVFRIPQSITVCGKQNFPVRPFLAFCIYRISFNIFIHLLCKFYTCIRTVVHLYYVLCVVRNMHIPQMISLKYKAFWCHRKCPCATDIIRYTCIQAGRCILEYISKSLHPSKCSLRALGIERARL